MRAVRPCLTGFLVIFGLGVSSLATAAVGGQDSGGGNLEPSRLASESDVENFARAGLPKLLQMYFNYGYDPALGKPRHFAGISHTSASQERLSLSTAAKLFGRAPSVFDQLKTVTFQIQHDPCQSPVDGESKDGSAIDGRICLSAGRLANRYTMNEYQKAILALAAHEASHLLGATEEEAKYIENQTWTIVKFDSRTIAPLEDRLTDLRLALQDDRNLIQSTKDKLNLSGPSVCLLLQTTQDRVGQLKESTYQFEQIYGLSLFDPSEQSEIWAALLKLTNITAFCKSTSIGQELKFFDNFRGGESVLSLATYRDRLTYYPNHGETGTIRKLSSGDKNAVANELEDISSLLTRALALVKQ